MGKIMFSWFEPRMERNFFVNIHFHEERNIAIVAPMPTTICGRVGGKRGVFIRRSARSIDVPAPLDAGTDVDQMFSHC
jgi:hypothetical protein